VLSEPKYFITDDHLSASALYRLKLFQREAQERASREYRSLEVSLSVRSAFLRERQRTEACMINFRTFCLGAIRIALTAIGIFAQAVIHAPYAYASNETATKPWSAPVGHRQPRAIDIPGSVSATSQIIDQEDANIDRKIKGVCRGC
jgi:hypothetical protein